MDMPFRSNEVLIIKAAGEISYPILSYPIPLSVYIRNILPV
jgi:hypothetical protein